MATIKCPSVTYFSNYYDESGYDYDDYLNYCAENDIEDVADESSDNFAEWVDFMLENDWEDFKHNLKYEDNFAVAVLGTCGTWRGNIEIHPKRFDNLLDAINSCISNCDFFEIKLENGYLKVKSSHHDGTNYFTIKKISDRGLLLDWDDVTEFKTYMGKKIEGYLY